MTTMTEEFKRALVKGDIKACVALLDGGADINVQDRSGWTALHLASYDGHAEVCQMLLDRGANIHAQDKFGMTALHCASACGQVDVCMALLNHGADLQAKDIKCFAAIDRAETNHPETADAMRAWLCRKQARAAISDLATTLKPPL